MVSKGLGLAIAAVGAVAAYAFSNKSESKSSGSVPGLPNAGTGTATRCQFDANIPEPIAAGVEQLLYGAIAPQPAELRSAADMLQLPYPMAAGCLRARANELEAGGAKAQLRRGRSPFSRA